MLGQPDRLCGFPIVLNQHMPDIAAEAKTILVGSRSKYKIRFCGGPRMRRLVERYADQDQEGFVAFQRFDGNLLDAGTNPVKVLQMHS
jgi:HK97 family phage major capsid protein